MTSQIVKLDQHKGGPRKPVSNAFRRPANILTISSTTGQPHIADLKEQMHEEHHQALIKALDKWRFVLEHYARSPKFCDPKVQNLIKRALGEVTRLNLHEVHPRER